MGSLKMNYTKMQFLALVHILKGSYVEMISDKDKAELVKDIIVNLVLRLIKRYGSLKAKNNIVTLNRLEMIAIRAIMNANFVYLHEYERVIARDLLTAIDKKEIYTIKPLELKENN